MEMEGLKYTRIRPQSATVFFAASHPSLSENRPFSSLPASQPLFLENGLSEASSLTDLEAAAALAGSIAFFAPTVSPCQVKLPRALSKFQKSRQECLHQNEGEKAGESDL
jgi:hypothetical protein